LFFSSFKLIFVELSNGQDLTRAFSEFASLYYYLFLSLTRSAYVILQTAT
jgi:hypothetical protein